MYVQLFFDIFIKFKTFILKIYLTSQDLHSRADLSSFTHVQF